MSMSLPMHKLFLVLPALLLAGCGGASDAPLASANDAGGAARIEADVRYLADDLLEGREAGTRGYDLAARYVAERFRGLGLQPAGDDGYLQPVPLLRAAREREASRFVIHGPDGARELAFEAEFLPSLNYLGERFALRAPAVFVGQGVHAPELGQDHFAGVNLTGKIAVVLGNAPADFPSTERAIHASSRVKREQVAARGAVGIVWIGDPRREAKNPWARGAANWARPGMRLVGADGAPVDVDPRIRAGASLSVDAARALFAGAPMDPDVVFAALDAGTLEAFDLAVELEIEGGNTLEPLTSHNVVARLPGRGEPSGESLVLTAHLDHVGIGAEVEGDAIYNGALDNALGVAVVLEAARALAANPPAGRDLLFAALTAEEKGLLGAEQLARRPPASAGRIVGNLNVDMPVILAELSDVIPIGIDHTSFAAPARAAAEELGITLTPDPIPEEVVFVRSDQFAFIRQGIPALYLDGGIVAVDPAIDGRALLDGFLKNHYHRPSDEVALGIHYPTAARLAALTASVARRAAESPEPPRWNEGDVLAERFAR